MKGKLTFRTAHRLRLVAMQCDLNQIAQRHGFGPVSITFLDELENASLQSLDEMARSRGLNPPPISWSTNPYVELETESANELAQWQPLAIDMLKAIKLNMQDDC